MGEQVVVIKKKGITWFGALMLILITLKLTGHIQAHWVWVFAPVWGGPALVIGLVGVFVGALLVIFAGYIVIKLIQFLCEGIIYLLKGLWKLINRGLDRIIEAKERRARLKAKGVSSERTNLD